MLFREALVNDSPLVSYMSLWRTGFRGTRPLATAGRTRSGTTYRSIGALKKWLALSPSPEKGLTGPSILTLQKALVASGSAVLERARPPPPQLQLREHLQGHRKIRTSSNRHQILVLPSYRCSNRLLSRKRSNHSRCKRVIRTARNILPTRTQTLFPHRRNLLG